MRLLPCAPPVAVALFAVVPLALRGQTIKKCDEPRAPIGYLHQSSATVWYRLDKNARPDTASVGVVTTIGISIGGARSVAVRVLGACRFDLAKGTVVANGLVTQIRFDTSGVSLGTTDRVDAAPALLTAESSTLPNDSLPLPVTDPRVDEGPRPLKCPQPQLPTMQSTSGRAATAAEARAAALADMARQIDGWNRMNSGQLVANIVVESDARIAPGMTVVSSTNPTATSVLSSRIRNCTWVPGRFHGAPIPVRMQAATVIPPLPVPGQ